MKNLLTELWYGRISPHDDIGEHGDEIRELLQLIEKNQHDLSALLGEKGKEILEIMNDNLQELRTFDREDSFIKGFTLGVRLMREATED